jgi:hypothetical protein
MPDNFTERNQKPQLNLAATFGLVLQAKACRNLWPYLTGQGSVENLAPSDQGTRLWLTKRNQNSHPSEFNNIKKLCFQPQGRSC